METETFSPTPANEPSRERKEKLFLTLTARAKPKPATAGSELLKEKFRSSQTAFLTPPGRVSTQDIYSFIHR